MSFPRVSFAFGSEQTQGMWMHPYQDVGRKSKRKAAETQQEFHQPIQHQQQQETIFHDDESDDDEPQAQGPGIPLEPSHHPLHFQHHPYNQHGHHPSHPPHLPPHPPLHSHIIPPTYDAAYPPRPPVIDPITALPVPANPAFQRPPSALHDHLFPTIDPHNEPAELAPHHHRRPPFHVNPVVPVGDPDVHSHPLADMHGNDSNRPRDELPIRPPFEEPTPEQQTQEAEQSPPEDKENEASSLKYKRRRIYDSNEVLKTPTLLQPLPLFANPQSTPSIQSPIHSSTNSSAVSMSPATHPATSAFMPSPSPLSLSAHQSATRLFADISNVPSASTASSISSSASASLMGSPQMLSTPIASLVRSPMLRPLNGRYAHLQPITNKGFGATYKAWDLQTSKPVFLKCTVLSSRVFSQREASFMKLFTCFRRRYPGSLRFLVDYVDDFVCQLESNEAPCHWLALDYVSGGDLVQLLRECHSLARPLQEDDVRIIIYRLCDAIRELHSLRVVHMDVSLENICIQWLNGENGEEAEARVQLLLIDFEWSMMDMRGNALQQMIAQMDAEAQAATGTPQFHELQSNAMEMRRAYDHVMLHPTPMHYYSDQYLDRRLRLQRRHEAVGKISYLSSEAKNLHSSFDPYKNEVFAIGACAYRLMFMCGPGEKNALTDSRSISNEFLSFLTETFQPEDKRIASEDVLSHPWLAVVNSPNHVRGRSQTLAMNQQLNSAARVVGDKATENRWQQFEMDEKSTESSA